MADRQRNVEVKVKLSKDGNLEVFRQLADDANDFGKAGVEAGKAIDRLQGQIERNGSASDKSFSRAKQAVSDYRRELEEAAQSGAQIGDAEHEKLALLEEAYATATQRAGEFRKEQQQVKRELDDATEAAGGQATAVHSLADIVNKFTEDLGPGAVKFASWSAAAVGAFTAGYEAGTRLKKGLDWLTDGDFSKTAQFFFSDLGDSIANTGRTMSTAAERADLLRNQLHILAKNGIDATGLSADEVQAKVDQLGKAMQKTSLAAQDGAKKVAEFAKSLPNKEEAEGAAQALAGVIADFQRINNLPAPKLREVFGAELQGVLDDIQRTGGKVPSALQSWVAGLNVLPSNLDRIRGEVEQRVDALFKAFGGKPESVLSVQQRVNEINAALEKLGHIPTGDAAKAVHDAVQAIVDEVRAAHGKLTPELEELADKFHVVTTAMERVGDNSIIIAKGAKESAAAFQQQIEALNHTSSSLSKADDAGKGFNRTIEDTRGAADHVTQAVRAAGEAAKEAGDKTATAADNFKKPGLAAATSKEALEDIAENMRLVAQRSGEASAELPKAADGLNKIGPAAAGAQKALQDLGGSVNFGKAIDDQTIAALAALGTLEARVVAVAAKIANLLVGSQPQEGPGVGGAGGG